MASIIGEIAKQTALRFQLRSNALRAKGTNQEIIDVFRKDAVNPVMVHDFLADHGCFGGRKALETIRQIAKSSDDIGIDGLRPEQDEEELDLDCGLNDLGDDHQGDLDKDPQTPRKYDVSNTYRWKLVAVKIFENVFRAMEPSKFSLAGMKEVILRSSRVANTIGLLKYIEFCTNLQPTSSVLKDQRGEQLSSTAALNEQYGLRARDLDDRAYSSTTAFTSRKR